MISAIADIPLTGATQVLGIIGNPIAHSLSPPMQNAALRALGINAVYVPFAVQSGQVETAIAGLYALGVQGFNITIPHKQAVMPHLASVTDLATAVGAVNTAWRTPTGWAGTNTDVLGFITPLQGFVQDWSRCRVVVLGNGGAARAVVAGCTQLGCGELWVVGRNPEHLQTFAASWQSSPLAPALHTATWDALDFLLPETTLLVNTTPLGMPPHADASPLSPAQMAQLPEAAIAYDLIYTPSPTQFLKIAAQRGLHTLDGLEMLVQQGAAALEIWTQQRPPIATMRQVLKKHLGLA
jgi:shikimate dehydrogenase